MTNTSSFKKIKMSGLQINHTIIWKCHLSIHVPPVHTQYDTTSYIYLCFIFYKKKNWFDVLIPKFRSGEMCIFFTSKDSKSIVTDKTDRHDIKCNWNIVESGTKHHKPTNPFTDLNTVTFFVPISRSGFSPRPDIFIFLNDDVW
jgi:hypothetical protein